MALDPSISSPGVITPLYSSYRITPIYFSYAQLFKLRLGDSTPQYISYSKVALRPNFSATARLHGAPLFQWQLGGIRPLYFSKSWEKSRTSFHILLGGITPLYFSYNWVAIRPSLSTTARCHCTPLFQLWLGGNTPHYFSYSYVALRPVTPTTNEWHYTTISKQGLVSLCPTIWELILPLIISDTARWYYKIR